jgi:hypothetical protein
MRMARVVLALYYARFRQVPRRITRDIDDSFGDVHGARQSRLFNAYYDQYSFHPLVVFDADARAPDRRPERWADLNHCDPSSPLHDQVGGLLDTGPSMRQTAKHTGLPRSTVHRIKAARTKGDPRH